MTSIIDNKLIELRRLSADIRIKSLQMVHRANASHIGGALSMADLLAVLYSGILKFDPNNPVWEGRDRFILSKGHACSSFYATLALKGFFPEKELETFGQNGSRLMTHVSHRVPGVELSTGSLGHGLPIGCGKALAAKRKGYNWKVFVMLSDGEMDEGSNWEAILFASQHKLDNLVAIIDYNKIQSMGEVANILDLEPLKEKLGAFRWSVLEIDGHDHDKILSSLSKIPLELGKPLCVIAHTVKGKGVSFMENELKWHYKSPDQNELKEAVRQIETNYA